MLYVRPMDSHDIDQVLAIEQRSFDHGWSRQQFLDEATQPGHAVVCEEDGLILGYLCLRWVADEAEVLDIAVLPEARRRGVARDLLSWGFQQAQQVGATIMHLEVRETSQPAIELYQQQGFQVVGRRPGYYPGGIAALLMTKHIARNDDI